MSRHLYNLDRQTRVLLRVGYHMPCISAGEMSFPPPPLPVLLFDITLSRLNGTEGEADPMLADLFTSSTDSSAADEMSPSLDNSPKNFLTWTFFCH